MVISDVILPELYNWSLSTGWCAALLIVSTIIVLVVNIMSHRNVWWRVLFLLFTLGVGIWSLVVAFNFYQQWLSFVGHAPIHGLIAYNHAINETYLADVYRSQIQFAVTAVLLMLVLFLAGWGYLRSVKRRVAQRDFLTE